MFASVALFGADIAVVYAERSVAESERAYAKRRATYVERLYDTVGLEADLVSDVQFAQKSCKLAILVNCYKPPADFIEAVRKKQSQGTRFVVCYSSSDALAKLFGLKTKAFERGIDGAWTKMRFLSNRPAGGPLEILQSSASILSMQSIDKTTVPMAMWCNRQGKDTAVAWWKTATGSYWMTQLLMANGDETNTQRLLLAIAAEALPHAWMTAAHFRYQKLRPRLENEETEERIEKLPKQSPRRQQLDKTFAQLKREHTRVQALLASNKKGYEAYQAVCDLEQMSAYVYGMTYWARPGEVCGVWDHFGQGFYAGDWERTAREMAAFGITDMYVNVAGTAFARYASKVVPQRTKNDCLREAVAACKKYGIRVHAWILAYSAEQCDEATRERFAKSGWLMQDAKGRTALPVAIDPSHPEVTQHLIKLIDEIASYKVDGIHLDFMRFPEIENCTSPTLRKRFEAKYGPVAAWPKDVLSGSRKQDFINWRSKVISDNLLTIRLWMKTHHPRLPLSVAVYGKYPKCVDTVGQNWMLWLRTDMVDMLAPMNYTNDLDSLRDWLGTQTAQPRYAQKFLCGIGVTANESNLDGVDVLKQIAIARQYKCAGFILFDLDETLRSKILPVLKEGATKRAQ
jgi:uncharacterized lipoprotein YddW (UPF0748 family)